MRHQHEGRARIAHRREPPIALHPKPGIPDGQHLVDDQDVGCPVHGARETEPCGHAPAVRLDGRLERVADLREVHDLGESPVDLFPRQAEDRHYHEDVLGACQDGIEANSERDQRGHPTPDRQ